LFLPLGREQPLNADRIASLGAGIHLPADAGPEQIRVAIEQIISNSAFARNAARVGLRMTTEQPDRRATELLAQAAAGPRD